MFIFDSAGTVKDFNSYQPRPPREPPLGPVGLDRIKRQFNTPVMRQGKVASGSIIKSCCCHPLHLKEFPAFVKVFMRRVVCACNGIKANNNRTGCRRRYNFHLACVLQVRKDKTPKTLKCKIYIYSAHRTLVILFPRVFSALCVLCVSTLRVLCG